MKRSNTEKLIRETRQVKSSLVHGRLRFKYSRRFQNVNSSTKTVLELHSQLQLLVLSWRMPSSSLSH